MSYRKALIAAVCTLPLVLTACGSDDKDAPSGAKQISASSSAAKKTDAKPEGASEQPKPGEPKPGEPNPADPNAPAPAPAPGDPNAPAPAPAPEGQPAPPAGPGNQADVDAIHNLVGGMRNVDQPFGSYLQFALDNSCSAYINAQGGPDLLRSQAQQAPNVPASVLLQGTPSFDIQNLQINGDEATATVVSTAAGQTQTENNRFLRENGRWTFCGTV